MYGPLILVNSTLANSAWIEGGIEKKKEGDRERERGGMRIPFGYIKEKHPWLYLKL